MLKKKFPVGARSFLCGLIFGIFIYYVVSTFFVGQIGIAKGPLKCVTAQAICVGQPETILDVKRNIDILGGITNVVCKQRTPNISDNDVKYPSQIFQSSCITKEYSVRYSNRNHIVVVYVKNGIIESIVRYNREVIDF